MPIRVRAFSLVDRHSDTHLGLRLQLSRPLKDIFPGGPGSSKVERELAFIGHGGALDKTKALKGIIGHRWNWALKNCKDQP